MPTIYSLTSLFSSSTIVEVHIVLKIVELETGPFKVHICCGSIGQPGCELSKFILRAEAEGYKTRHR